MPEDGKDVFVTGNQSDAQNAAARRQRVLDEQGRNGQAESQLRPLPGRHSQAASCISRPQGETDVGQRRHGQDEGAGRVGPR